MLSWLPLLRSLFGIKAYCVTASNSAPAMHAACACLMGMQKVLSTLVGRNGVSYSLKLLLAGDKPKICNIRVASSLLVYPDCDAYIFCVKEPKR
jgi:hypothetical protein